MTRGIRRTPDRMFEVYREERQLVAVASTLEEAERARAQMEAWWWSRGR